MLEIKNLHFSYRNEHQQQRTVLKNVHLTIRSGQSVGIMGANGSGKTTLARCLNGLLLPTSGDVLLDEMNSKDSENVKTIRRLVGMVFQDPENQIVSTTVEREIAFGLENIGIPHDEMHEIVEAMLKKMNLEQYRKHPPHLLSGGEMQRLALASVLAMSPKFIVFDEPTSQMEPAGRFKMIELIQSLNTTTHKVTPVLITQYPEEVLGLDRLLILHAGEIVYDDTPQNVFHNVQHLKELSIPVPVEYDVKILLEDLSNGKFTFNTSNFLPI